MGTKQKATLLGGFRFAANSLIYETALFDGGPQQTGRRSTGAESARKG
jgi:hypothetical protein